MRLQLLAAASVGVAACFTFEPADFDVVTALLDVGVDVFQVPGLSDLVDRSWSNACSMACSTLQTIFGNGSVFMPGESDYQAFTNSYWSVQQASVDPRCVFRPAEARQVSALVLLSRLSQCPFAVKSGGHAAFAGASSIQGGITVSLSRFNQVSLSENKQSATIGPGNVWYDVYTALEPHQVTVIGGRVAGIGVGGLTLGGGISFFSNIYGWACDNVLSYTVVTASGTIITASPSEHQNLFWALRGGGNNFGIVTSFNVRAIPQGLMWGGGRFHLETEFPAVIDAYYNLGVNAAKDGNAAQILSFAYVQNTKLASAALQYAQPVANASILAEYMSIPAIGDTTQIRSLANLTQEFNASNPDGLRETYWAATFKLDRDFVAFIKDVFFEELVAIADAPALIPAATLQVITVPQLEHMAQNGGNALGLGTALGPLIVLNMNMMWSDAADDERVMTANANIVRRTGEEAEKRGLQDEYIYMNYASQYQDVVGGYGAANQERLRSVAKSYDPAGVWQKLQPGYFKLDGAPAKMQVGGK
ncbi:FAD binding domain-containing protein [Polyplosphaeria fusca]|uniref:FAD binding domain-containing protein n=1 Tax=Polyplosphaeria fusca TaxID=682080 RepID=A0A9P4QKP5_9PLEO|nr:FAD binding domain-containing protein [Polyplosphaeria fusca]